MSKNPFLNGLAASLYIVLVVTFMTFGTSRLANQPDTFFAPIAFISLFTFSVAVMGYLFCLIPIQLYLDGQKKQAVRLFTQTLGVFGGLTLVVLTLLLLGF